MLMCQVLLPRCGRDGVQGNSRCGCLRSCRTFTRAIRSVRVDRRSVTVPRLRAPSSMAAAAVGDLFFSPVGGAVAVYPPGSTWGPRTLPDFELVWILEGDTVWTCNGTRHAAPPGTMILSRP